MTTIILVSILGAVIAAVVGTFWYSNATPMGKIHMRYVGFDKLSKEEQESEMRKAKPMMIKMYAGQIFLSFLTSFAVVFIIITSLRNGLTLGMAMGFIALNWLCFVVPTVGSGILWGNCDRKIAWKKFFSDIFVILVTVLIVAYVASLFA